MFPPTQVGMIQMVADKNNVKKKKPNKRLYTRTYVYCKQTNQKGGKTQRKRGKERMVGSTTHEVKNLKTSYILP